MKDLLFALDAVAPIVLIIALGYVLKKVKLLNKNTLDTLNKLCFKVLLPIQIFINVYDSSSIRDLNWILFLYILIASLVIYLLVWLYVVIFVKQRNQRGVMLQGIFRANYTIIGIPLARSIAQEAGARVACLVTLVTIPLSNILSTIGLTMFVNDDTNGHHFLKMVKKVVTNPLIIGVMLGIICLAIRMLFEELNISFRLSSQLPFLYNPIKLISAMTSPLALITLGGLFEFTYIKGLKRLVACGVIGKLVAVPLMGLVAAVLFFDFTGAEYATLIAVFASPVAVSSAVMAKEMKNDDILANQIVVWTTVMSGISLFIIIFLFKAMNIF